MQFVMRGVYLKEAAHRYLWIETENAGHLCRPQAHQDHKLMKAAKEIICLLSVCYYSWHLR